MKLKRLVLPFSIALLAGVIVTGIGGLIWLRSSPYWAGITLFTEANRVENFRAMDQIFPYRSVTTGKDVWKLAEAPHPLPETYVYEGETSRIDRFLKDTVTTGLLVLHNGAITHEEYRLGATETSQFTSWSLAKSVLSALIGIAL